jgi:hypothetical protein
MTGTVGASSGINVRHEITPSTTSDFEVTASTNRTSWTENPRVAGSIPTPALNDYPIGIYDNTASQKLSFPNSFPNIVHGVPGSSADV